ncbi:MAG: M66 family metalloprotease [Myxococcales bacterium]
MLLTTAGVAACVGTVEDPDTTHSDLDPSTASVDQADASADEGDGDRSSNPDDDAVRDAGSAQQHTNADAGTPGKTPDPCGPDSESLVETLRIKDVALYQTVKVTLVSGGAWVSEQAAPVTQGKEALVRVFAEPLTGYSAHAVLGTLTLQNGSQVTRLEARLTPSKASTDADFGSTFNFNVPAAALGPDTTLSAALVEEKCNPKRKDNPGARFPKSGAQALSAEDLGTLRVTLVPVRLGTLLPDTSAAQIESIRSALAAYYPVAKVEVNVAAALTWAYSVDANGDGWSELLNEIRKQRQRDGAPRNTYYFGLITPKSTLRTYCSGSCVLGLAPQTVNVSSVDQIGLGVGYIDDNTPSTAVHELGHAHGRGHSPCVPSGGKIDGVDAKYPYTGGDIGSWGWDARSKTLMQPTLKDMMGYCEPTWISDYTYSALAARSLIVNNATSATTKSRTSALIAGGPWHSLILYGNGSARWAGFVTSETPGGEFEPLRVRDAQGNLVAELEASRVHLDHSSESFLYIPEPQANWATLEVGGLTIALSSVLPEL